ncbi:LysR family transcriptional regulator [Gordonia humi]|uniref:DNA-binding transcriptional LysR family regulator n=1 Tax=Gordonia humi TaxID=686429 RepID=A0A840EP26_9ACTN|nr:LysR family transcriptional regulator [Gordonia humi]MBB4134565.1 DNA-binding transcriptional LysR family regulator [Gordonia humi]
MVDPLRGDALRYVQAVARTGSFSAAARSCGVSQPALSNGVARLEDHLGHRLFDRSTRGVRLTAFGARLLPRVDAALVALDDITAETRRWAAPTDADIRLGVSPLIGSDLIGRTHGAVSTVGDAAQHLVLHEANVADLLVALRAGDLDLLIVPSVGPLPGYEHRIVGSEPVVVVESSPPDDGPVDLRDLTDQSLILLPDTCGLTTFTQDLFTSHGFPVNRYRGEASSYRVLEEWANLGLGSAMIPESKLASSTTRRRRVHDDNGEVEIFYAAIWDPSTAKSAELRSVVDLLTE